MSLLTRNAFRFARLASRQTNLAMPRTAQPPTALPAARRGFKAHPVGEEFPTVLHGPEGETPSAVPPEVEKVAAVGPTVPETNTMEKLTALSEDVYNKLPQTVKSMTVKGKVILVTG
jgi:hypothetical protein